MPVIVDKSSITKVCVDDFALRKRFSYGTVMVDLESHRIIDLIPSRETADVASWFATFPNIQVISRDGAAEYSCAVKPHIRAGGNRQSGIRETTIASLLA